MTKYKLNNYLSKVSLLLVGLIGSSSLYYLSRPPTDTLPPTPIPKAQKVNSAASKETITLNQIESWKLFGPLSKSHTGHREEAEYKETSLPIVIKGLLSNETGGGWAIFALDKGEEKIIRKGMEIKPGIRVERLEQGYAVIINKGVSEKVALSDFSDIQGLGIEKSRKEPNLAETEKAEEKASGILQAIRNAGLRRVSKESASGYVVIGEDNRANKQFNLKKGDVINSVNGYPVGSDSADNLAFKTYQRTGKASVEISRSGETIYIEYPL
ncbi:type II secretion system protein N [Alloalcanivorax profundimaris]|uniref:type II secretion system protein N n=1 Tax=Alloalcanivorax profundimaris TaxID=2735259 RepID=UPI001888E1D6|nr:type II secretion system protein N [Alloalcanivorax profundimaris]MBF1802573.1 hypothetical protein [Alloalcanivorax profundimaris]MCQ6263557.1 hypothetical protein [Alcanivorax sp. MM125-6]